MEIVPSFLLLQAHKHICCFTYITCIYPRLLGIGRNQYIDLMNQTRSKTKFGGFSTSLFRYLTTSLIAILTTFIYLKYAICCILVSEKITKITFKYKNVIFVMFQKRLQRFAASKACEWSRDSSLVGCSGIHIWTKLKTIIIWKYLCI